MELPYDPTIPFLGLYLREIRLVSYSKSLIPMFIAELSTVAKKLKYLSDSQQMNVVIDIMESYLVPKIKGKTY